MYKEEIWYSKMKAVNGDENIRVLSLTKELQYHRSF